MSKVNVLVEVKDQISFGHEISISHNGIKIYNFQIVETEKLEYQVIGRSMADALVPYPTILHAYTALISYCESRKIAMFYDFRNSLL